MCPNAYKTADIVTFNDKILNRKFHFLCSHFVLNLQCLAIGCTSQPTVSQQTSTASQDIRIQSRPYKKQENIQKTTIHPSS